MDKEDIHLDDWQRILFGQAPMEFLLEVVFRTLLVYLILLVVIRLLGKRMSAQLTVTEMAVFITLGAIVSLPMQAPDRGILPGVVILACVLVLQRGLSWLSIKSRKIEILTQGDVSLLVKDGVLQLDSMRQASISQEQLFAQLRGQKIYHLGKIKRVYLEGDGHFSILQSKKPQPGLSLLPTFDTQLTPSDARAEQLSACSCCATVVASTEADQACATCGHRAWTYAMKA